MKADDQALEAIKTSPRQSSILFFVGVLLGLTVRR